MKNLNRAWLILILIVLFFPSLHCVSTANYQFLDPEYQNLNYFSASLMVMTLNTDWIDREVQQKLLPANVVKHDMFNQQERDYFNNYMGPALAEKTTAKIYGIDPLFKPTGIEFSYRQLQIEGEFRIEMFIPVSGKVKYYDTVPDYVLFFEDLMFEKDFREESGGLGRGTVQKYSMKAAVNYLIWDNNKQKIVAYGRLHNDLNFLDLPTRDNYVQHIFTKPCILFQSRFNAIINDF